MKKIVVSNYYSPQATIARIPDGEPMDLFERAKALFFEGLAHFECGEYEQSEQLFGESLGLLPDRPSTLTNLALAQIRLGRVDAAETHCLRALELEPQSPEGWLGLGLIAVHRADHAAGLDFFLRALGADPDCPEAWLNKGVCLLELKRPRESLAAAERAVALMPASVPALLSRGAAREATGDPVAALADFDLALALAPALADAHSLRGRVLQEIDRRAEALEAWQSALALTPSHLDTTNALVGFHLSELVDVAEIARYSSAAAAANVERDLARLRTSGRIPDFHVFHDVEQSNYLIEAGYDFPGLRAAHTALSEAYAAHQATRGHDCTIKQLTLSAAQIEAVACYRRAAPTCAVDASMECLNPANNWRAIEEQYLDSCPEVVVIDDFLSPAALAELRRFCLTATVWNRDYFRQYLGAFPYDGFASPLHVRIGAELRRRLPRVCGPHRLEQLWGFKYTSQLGGGINVHADFARVNLNFWITPDAANLDPASGGLVVYDAPCPPNWGFAEYNQDEVAIYGLLRERGASKRVVTYRGNRAVLFNSNLFHETDRIDFAKGYENRRINVTYLFGRGLTTY